MSRERFVSLVKDFCKSCGIDDPMGVVQGGAVEVDGVRFTMIQSDKIDPQLLIVYCDLGEPLRSNEARLYANLLTKNFYHGATRGPVFTLEPDTGRPVMVLACELAALTPELLAKRLGDLSDQAADWRHVPFENTPSNSTRPQNSLPSASALSRSRPLQLSQR